MLSKSVSLSLGVLALLLTISYGCDDARSRNKNNDLLDDTPINPNPSNNSPLDPLLECEALCDRLGAECADDLRAAGCSEAAMEQAVPTCQEACASLLPRVQLLTLADFECAEAVPALLSTLPALEAACQPTCTDGCAAAGAARCAGGGDVETCQEGPLGCLQWVANAACSPGRVCDDSSGTIACICSGEVWEGDFEGDSTAELEGVTRLQGNLTLHGGGADLLDGLNCLKEVTGALSIQDNAALKNVDGLASLTSVGWNLILFNNASLSQLDGLASLTSVRGSLLILDNDALVDVSGLSSLMSVGGMLDITDNGSLCAEEVTALIDLLRERMEPDPMVGELGGNTGSCDGG